MRARNYLASLTAIAALGFFTASAHADTHTYRDEVTTKTLDLKYASEISAMAATTGTYYKVDTDAQGRITRTVEVRDGKDGLTRQYHFAGDAKLPSSFDDSGENVRQAGTTQIHRNAAGVIQRTDRARANGDAAGYTTYEDKGDHVEATTVNAAGKQTDHRDYYFSAAGNCVRRVVHFPNADLDSTLDETTGRAITTKQIDTRSGQSLMQKFVYDPDGDITRIDVYNDEGRLFAGQEYVDGEVARRFYNYGDGTSRDIRYTYDDKKVLTASKIYYNGKFICSLSYDRDSEGSVKRTLAFGPDGELWAEYPAPEVTDVQDSGQPINRDDGVIHREGPWWGISAKRVE